MVQQACTGAGLGLRIPHIQYVLKKYPDIPWFEIHICNFLRGGINYQLLKQVAKKYPLSFHGVSLNLGGTEPLDTDYLQRLKKAVKDFQPTMISEHVCFTTMEGEYFHDLLPVPFTSFAIKHFSDRIDQVQNFLGQKILIENVSRYTTYKESEMSEAEFISAISNMSGCGIVLDLNNAYVNQYNLGESLETFIAGLPLENIGEVHLAGFSKQGDQLIDTHSGPVCDAVWHSFRQLNQLCADIPSLIEWDNQLPEFSILEQEQKKAQSIIDEYSVHQQHRIL